MIVHGCGCPWSISTFSPLFAFVCFRSQQTQDLWAAPPRGRVALYLAASGARPSPEASRPIGVTIAPPNTSAAMSRLLPRRQSGLETCLACVLHRGSRIYLYPVER
jgi:hypothetical protein